MLSANLTANQAICWYSINTRPSAAIIVASMIADFDGSAEPHYMSYILQQKRKQCSREDNNPVVSIVEIVFLKW